jgi:hypothetical protein
VSLTNGTDSLNFSTVSPQLYTGTEANPTLLTGVFTVPIDPLSYAAVATAPGMATRYGFAVEGTIAASPVPEPGTSGMLTAGIVLLCLGWRGRSRLKRFPPASASPDGHKGRG